MSVYAGIGKGFFILGRAQVFISGISVAFHRMLVVFNRMSVAFYQMSVAFHRDALTSKERASPSSSRMFRAASAAFSAGLRVDSITHLCITLRRKEPETRKYFRFFEEFSEQKYKSIWE